MKQVKKTICLLLALVMCLSLGPVPAFAEAELEELTSEEPAPVVEEIVSEEPAPVVEELASEEPAPVVEELVSEEPAPVVEELVSEEPAPVVEEPVSEEPAPAVEEPVVAEESDEGAEALVEDAYPMQSFNYRADVGTEITVDAPEGAFPEDTQMVVTELDLNEVQKLIDADEAVEGSVLAAADISFYHKGEKIQPLVPVYVSFASAAAAQAEDPRVIHISDASAVEVIENVESAVTFADEPMQMMAMTGFGTAEAPAASNEMIKLSFAANAFSGYAILAKAPKAAPKAVPGLSITVNLVNDLASAMWEGAVDIHGVAQLSFPASYDFDLSFLNEGETIGQGSSTAATYPNGIRAIYEAENNGGERAIYAREFRMNNTILNSSTSLKLENGQLMYLAAASGSTWTAVPENASFTLYFHPYYLLVKFDPNTGDASIAGDMVKGSMTINGTPYQGEQFIRFTHTTTTMTATGGSYMVADAADWPTKATMMSLTTTNWTPRDNNNAAGSGTGNFSALAQTGTLYVHPGTYSNSGHHVSNASRKPVVTAVYPLPTADTANVDPLYPDASKPGTGENGYPLINGKPQGSVDAKKSAEWVDEDMSIAKIILEVEGTTLKKGVDVVLVLDRSGSMGGRYRIDYPDRETYTKMAAYSAIQTLLSDPTDNNRVGIVNFSEGASVGVGLKTSNEMGTVLGYMQQWTVENHNTHSKTALQTAYNLLEGRSTQEKQLRKGIILFVTDGEPYPPAQNPTEALLNQIGGTTESPKYELYTIGISLPTILANRMAGWARPQDGEHAENVAEPAGLIAVFEEIARRIVNAGEEAAFADDVSVYFNSGGFTAEEIAQYGIQNSDGVTVNGDQVSIDVGTITPEKKTYVIYIKVNPDHYDDVASGAVKTNDNVSLTYIDPYGNSVTIPKEQIGDPVLSRGKASMQIEYYRVNDAGEYINSEGVVVAENQKNQARVSIETVAGIFLETTSSELYQIHADGGPNVSNDTNEVWGKIPAGYDLWPSEQATKTQTITTDYSVTYHEEFKVVAPYAIVKARNDDAAHLDGSDCIGYAAGEQIPYSLTVTNRASKTMTEVKVVDKATVPSFGNEPEASGTFSFVNAVDGSGAPVTGVSYDAATHTFTIPSIPGQGVVVLNYTYTVPASEVGKRIDNWATVMGIKSNVVQTPTRFFVTKVWNDLQDQGGLRPDEVVVNLKASGVSSGQSVTLNANNNWTGWFTADDGSTTYTVEEEPVANYKTSCSGSPTTALSTGTGFTVTNTLNVFYVYHSSDNTVDIVPMPKSGTFDLTAKVKDGYLYGGYYANYQKKGTEYTGGPIRDTNGAAVNHGKDSGGTAYTGGAGKWLKGKAFTATQLSSGVGGPGNAMTPAAGATYYLKEVPVDYLKPYMVVVYDTHNNNSIVRMYLLSAIDDLNYNDIGLDAVDITTGNRIALAASYTISNEFTGVKTKITPNSAFGVSAGFLPVWQPPELPSGDSFTYQPYFVTPDGVKVSGLLTRTVEMGNRTVVGQFQSPGITYSET